MRARDEVLEQRWYGAGEERREGEARVEEQEDEDGNEEAREEDKGVECGRNWSEGCYGEFSRRGGGMPDAQAGRRREHGG